MASSTNSVKLILSSLIRKRLAFTNELSDLYGPSINRRKGKLIELIKEKAEIGSQSAVVKKLRVFKEYYTLEMSVPSTAEEMTKLKADLAVVKDFFKSGCYKFLTVRQAWLLLLVATEVGLWFYLGETMGKMHIVGYKVD